jgi:cytochrome c oxidase subunit 3
LTEAHASAGAEAARGGAAAVAPAHQFDSVEQQHEAVTVGMWLFLATEVMFFGGLLLGYAVYRRSYPDAFAAASGHLDLRLGALNTAVLITSSLTMALAVHAAQLGERRRLVGLLLATIALGSAFLVVKGVEYHHKFEQGLFPDAAFRWPGPDAPHVRLFFSFYFCLTGLHAAHMVIGIGLLSTLVVLAARGHFGAGRASAVEMSGLYWHFVDIVWIFLFPLLYLIGGARHG